MQITALELIKTALGELNVLQQGQNPNAGQQETGLRCLNGLFDDWNAMRAAVVASVFLEFTITPNLQAHTIGPTGTWSLSVRPVSIDGAMLILNNVTPNVKIPITMRPADWWRRVPVPGITSSIVTDIYYEPDWPNGTCYLYPKPTTAYRVMLQNRTILDDGVTIATSLYFPPGYYNAMMYTLAERLATPFGRAALAKTVELAKDSRARIYTVNDVTPNLRTQDAGMPGGVRHRPDFFWPDGSIR